MISSWDEVSDRGKREAERGCFINANSRDYTGKGAKPIALALEMVKNTRIARCIVTSGIDSNGRIKRYRVGGRMCIDSNKAKGRV